METSKSICGNEHLRQLHPFQTLRESEHEPGATDPSGLVRVPGRVREIADGVSRFRWSRMYPAHRCLAGYQRHTLHVFSIQERHGNCCKRGVIMGIPLSDYLSMQERMRRVAGRIEDQRSALGVEREFELHRQILDECARRGWIALHGSMAHRTHRIAGEFDFVILADGGRVLLVECKTKTGKLTTEQQALHAWARKLGHEPKIVRSLGGFLNEKAEQ